MDSLVRIRSFLKRCFTPPRPESTKRFQDEMHWYDERLFPGTKPDVGELLVEYATRRWEEMASNIERIEEKADSLLKTASVLAALILTAVAYWKLRPLWFALPAFCCYLASMGWAILLRWPFVHGGPTTARNLIDAVKDREDPRELLAASIHRATEAARIYRDWKATHYGYASLWLLAGVALTVLVLFMSP